MNFQPKTIKALAAFAIPHVLVLLFCMASIITGIAMPYLSDGFGIDSSGRIYVGEQSKISVYENGDKINEIPTWLGHHYITVDSGDNLRIITSSGIHIWDLSGNEIQYIEDRLTDEFYYTNTHWRKQVTPSGDTYRVVDNIGWSRIVKNETETVYRISVFSLVVKLLLVLTTISMFINGTVFIFRQKYS